MKKKIILFFSISLAITFFSFGNSNQTGIKIKDNISVSPSWTLDSRKLDANNISTWFRNNGNFNRDPVTSNAGFEWPRSSGNFLRYSSGFWIGCTVGNDTLTAMAEYVYDYKPGFVDNNGNPQGQDDPLYRIYRIERGDTTSPDYLNWPVSQGAYVNSNGKPFFLGTQTMFYSYTDAYPHSSISSSDSSLKVQILQTNWCYSNLGYENVIFSEFKIINRSHSKWNNTFLSVWTDDDIGDGSLDKVACDTIRNMQYTYSAHNNNPVYGVSPPAVGTKVLRSPIFYTGNINDSARYYDPPGSLNLKTKIGYKFSGVSVYNAYNNTSPQPSDPSSNTETYRVLRGLWNNGNAWIDPFTGEPTTKPFSGNPVLGTGWLMPGDGNRKSLISCGPISINPNDTQSIIIAQIVARGSNYLMTIQTLKYYSDIVQSIYDQNFQSVLSVKNTSSQIPEQFKLSQNYPNPFNPMTKIRFDIPSDISRQTSDVKLTVYNALGKEVAALVNEKLSAGSYEVEFDGSSLTSGVYFYRLTADGFSGTKRMILLK